MSCCSAGAPPAFDRITRREWSFDVRRQYREPANPRDRKLYQLLRTGLSLAETELFVTHPSTWFGNPPGEGHDGAALVAADPSQDEVDRIWGISMLVTTQLTPGVEVLLGSIKFGRMAVREPLSGRWDSPTMIWSVTSIAGLRTAACAGSRASVGDPEHCQAAGA